MEEMNFVVSGADLDPRELDTIKDSVKETARKLCSIYEGENSLNVHVKTHNEEGKRKKYSLKAALQTPVGTFHSKSDDWDIMIASSECMRRLERIVIEDHKKHIKKTHTKD